MSDIREIDFTPEFTFKTSRSGGKGGQNVNKVETKVELSFNVAESDLLTEKQKARIQKKLNNKINNEGNLQITSQEYRSQLKNKKNTIALFYDLIEEALKKKKKRKKSKPSAEAKEKRLKEKKKQSEKKRLRRNPEP